MDAGDNGARGTDTLLVLQPKSFRSFSNKDEYLYAMKEDLADWFTCLYKIHINGEIFFEVLETGILLCQHANEVINFTKERKKKGIEIIMKSYFVRTVPEHLIQYKENVKPGSFLARDNISNFIAWCRLLGIPDDLRFETEDLVTRKNEKSVILCLLEVARVGAKLGMLAPTIVQMEEEIDAELAGEPPPQIITCDLKSLDEMVRHLVGMCTCPSQFPMVKVGDGKYQVGESKTLIFVRILRNHVMVRVGGGWDTLERYLDKHDPCRCQSHKPIKTPPNPVRSQISRRSLSPVPATCSATTPTKSKVLPKTPDRRKSNIQSPALNKSSNISGRCSTPKGILSVKRQTSVESTNSDNMELANGDKVDLDEIKTMTLDDFRNLLNSSLTPSGANISPQDSKTSQDNFKDKTKSLVRHGSNSDKGPSWKEVREKAKNVHHTMIDNNGKRNKTPSIQDRDERSKTPITNTRISPARITDEDIRRNNRSKTPSKASSISSLDEESLEVANINYGLTRASKESSPDLDRNILNQTTGIPRTRSRTPSGIPRAITSTPTTPKMARKQSLPESTSVSRRSKTPIINTRSQIPNASRSVTPGPRESWQRPPLERQNSGNSDKQGDQNGRKTARSLEFSRPRSKSVIDIEDGNKDVKTNIKDDSASKLKSKMLAMAEKRRKSLMNSPKPPSNQQVLMVTRGKGGNHSVTIGDNGSKSYETKTNSNNNNNNSYLQKYRMRSKTPDPSMCNGRTKLIDPKLMKRRNSSTTSQSAMDKRLEDWVDSTINDNKRKGPKGQKGPPQSWNYQFSEEDLRPGQIDFQPLIQLQKEKGKLPVNPDNIPDEPHDQELCDKLQKLCVIYQEMELRAAATGTPVYPPLHSNYIGEDCSNSDSTSAISSKSTSSPAYSNNSGISTNSPAYLGHNTNTKDTCVDLDDNTLGSSRALVSKMKEVLKVRPRNEPSSGPRSRIPAPSQRVRSKSVSDLTINCDNKNDSRTDIDSAYENSAYDHSEYSDEISEISQMTTKFCDASLSEINCSTPVPKLATPLTTGRSTVLNKSNSSNRLVRAMSNEPAEYSRSNSMSSLSSRMSLSNAEDEGEYV